jgi:4-hydroxy-3-polyprenylbenzoate decarboxylase
MASLFFLPEGTDKASIAGWLRLEPIELVNAETSELLVPSTSEIVIEGEVPPHVRVTEGPYGEKTAGYSEPSLQPVINVKAITNRKNPIFPFTVDGAKVSDFMSVLSTTASLELIRIIRLHANLFVRWLNLPVEWGLTTAVGSIKPLFPGHPYQIAATAFSSRAGRLIDKLILVDDDVPAMEMTYIYWDFIEKNHPDRGIVIWEGNDASLSPLVAYTNEEDKKRGTGSKVLFDCTFPTTWPKEDIPGRLSFEHFPEEIRKRVLERWEKFGIKPKPQIVGR